MAFPPCKKVTDSLLDSYPPSSPEFLTQISPELQAELLEKAVSYEYFPCIVNEY